MWVSSGCCGFLSQPKVMQVTSTCHRCKCECKWLFISVLALAIGLGLAPASPCSWQIRSIGNGCMDGKLLCGHFDKTLPHTSLFFFLYQHASECFIPYKHQVNQVCTKLSLHLYSTYESGNIKIHLQHVRQEFLSFLIVIKAKCRTQMPETYHVAA